MTPADLSLTVLHAVRRAVDEGALRVEVPSRVKVERARPGGAGEYASNIALTLARPAGRSGLEVAGIIEERLRDVPGLAGVEITGPGFLNFTLRGDVGRGLVRAIVGAGSAYGHGTALAGTRVRFAEVSEARAAVVVETVVRLLSSQGAEAAYGGGDERMYVRPGVYAVDEFGVDAARWSLLRAAPQDRPLEGAPLLVQHERNGLFRVRYAYSRVRRLLVNGEQLGVTPAYEDDMPGETSGGTTPVPSGGTTPVPSGGTTPVPSGGTTPAPSGGTTPAPPPEARELVSALADYPLVLLAAARLRAPDRVARHLEVVADGLLGFQYSVLPLGGEKPSAAHRSRLAVAEAAGAVLAGGLSVLGISAPDRI
ncbi:ArgS-related anticodon-binding protein NrtL [Streptomyces sp. LMG1-1-1.1]|uniref:ArgS-related anticodon-binding protein NrtL n=1 Tax=Streptomyces sp. LMG1-1-1.1 TaxID=3135245 RepID=UPI003466C95F